MAVFKGRAMLSANAKGIVQTLHNLFGEDDLGNVDWTDDDAADLSGNALSRSWTVGDVSVDLNVDNFSPNDDPVMLTITPWKSFRTIIHNKVKSTV